MRKLLQIALLLSTLPAMGQVYVKGSTIIAGGAGGGGGTCGSNNIPCTNTANEFTQNNTFLSLSVTNGINGLEVYENTGLFNIGLGVGSTPTSATGSQNLGIGDGTLANLTSGYDNVAQGVAADGSVTTGAENIAFGTFVLQSNVTGNGNAGFGSLALADLVDSDNNTAAGEESLVNLTTGANNTAFGAFSGCGTLCSSTTGPINNVSNSGFFGFQTGPSTTGVTNQWLFGYSIQSALSNYMQLGNSSITAATIYGTPTFPTLTSSATQCAQLTAAGVLGGTGSACGSGGGGGSPTGAAGGGLGGTYPNPSIGATISVASQSGYHCNWNGTSGTDDSAAFSAATAAAGALYTATGTPIKVTYPKNCTLGTSGGNTTINIPSGVTVDGSGGSIFVPAGTTVPLFESISAGETAFNNNNITYVTNLTACGPTMNNAACVAYRWDGATPGTSTTYSDFTAENNVIYNSGWGILVGPQAGNDCIQHVHVNHNTIANLPGVPAYSYNDGIHLGGCVSNFEITGNIIQGRHDAGVAVTSEIYSGNIRQCQHGTITGNSIYENLEGIDVSGCSNVQVTSNYVWADIAAPSGVSNPAFRAIFYNALPQNLNIAGNTFHNYQGTSNDYAAKFDCEGSGPTACGNAGTINPINKWNSSFTGNYLSSTTSNTHLNALYLRGSNITVADNTFPDTSQLTVDWDGTNGNVSQGIIIAPNLWQGHGLFNTAATVNTYPGSIWYPQVIQQNWMTFTNPRVFASAESNAFTSYDFASHYTVSTLPGANLFGTQYAMVVVTDAVGPGTCVGGGSITAIAISNGSTWTCGPAGVATYTSVTVSSLTPGDCVQAGALGLLTTTGSPCGSGGGGSGPTTQTNGVNNSVQTLLNAIDSATVKWTNPPGTGNWSAAVPTATTSVFGVSVPDNTSIGVTSGVYSVKSTGANTVLGFNGSNVFAGFTAGAGISLAGGQISSTGITGSLGTTNCIPKASTSITLVCSSATDDGTTFTITNTGGLALVGTGPAMVNLGAGTGTLTLLPNSYAEVGPVTGGTSYVIQHPQTAASGFEEYTAGTLYGQPSIHGQMLSPEWNFAANTFSPSIYATGTVIASAVIQNNGHVRQLSGFWAQGTCTTPATINVYDVTLATVGTALTLNATGQATVVESLAYNAGDLVQIKVSSAGSGCSGGNHSVSAQMTTP